MAAPLRATAGSFTLAIDGVHAAAPQLARGGDAVGNVVEQVGPEMKHRKYLAGVRYTDIELTCGADMTSPMRDWIQATLGGTYLAKDGSLSAGSFDGKEQSRLDFTHAQLTGIGFPALDAASRGSPSLQLSLTPESARRYPGSGAEIGMGKPTKAWASASFRLEIPGLDTSRVMRVEPLVVRLAVTESAAGELRDYERSPTQLVVPNLVVTLSESARASWSAWHEDFVVNGNCGPDRERTGTLDVLAADSKSALFRLDFHGLGIVSLTTNAPTQMEQVGTIRAEMYCQEIAVTFPG